MSDHQAHGNTRVTAPSDDVSEGCVEFGVLQYPIQLRVMNTAKQGCTLGVTRRGRPTFTPPHESPLSPNITFCRMINNR